MDRSTVVTLFSAELTPDEFERFCSLIYKVSGIRIPHNKSVLVANRVQPAAPGNRARYVFGLLHVFNLARRRGGNAPLSR